MGGLVILASILLTSLIYVGRYKEIIPVLFMTLGFGLIGFLDDYIKVVKKRSLGLTPSQKMTLQFIVTGGRVRHFHKNTIRRRYWLCHAAVAFCYFCFYCRTGNG